MYKKFGFTLVIFLLTSASQACIWQQAEPAYWPSNNIQVCFTNMNQSERHQMLAQLVQNTLLEINRRTSFQLTGFSECQPTGVGTPQISINLDEGRTVGQASPNYQGGMSEYPNVFVPTHNSLGQEFIVGQAIHEVLHMFGIQHEHAHFQERDFGSDSPFREGDFYFHGSYNPDSVMVRTSATGFTPPVDSNQGWLAESDVQCLNMIAARDFPNQPGVSDLDTLYELVRDDFFIPTATSRPESEEKGLDPNLTEL